ncbi:hypothetical protein [Phaffia rhodozyma]|uniref:DUF7729 domain-containing protein n=1 Tax=Phaffia rhodozyma TaxID=264483 RepID=A0A0F7SNT3_PHARH|nr:hypothetical protein [Phaffia rhodozyma]
MPVNTFQSAPAVLLVLFLASLTSNALHSSDHTLERLALKVVDPPWTGTSYDDLSWVSCQKQSCIDDHDALKRDTLSSISSSSPSASLVSGSSASATENYISTAASTSSTPAQTTSTAKAAPAVTLVSSLVPDPFPQPFDLSLSPNLSMSCLDSFASFLTSSTFQACRPFSLLSTSSAFNQLIRSDLDSTTAVVRSTLDESIDGNECESYLNDVGKNLRKGCQSDLDKGNAIVNQALIGLGAYQMMRNASALLTSSGAYCFVEALASAEPDDLYYWSLYTGSPIPDETKTCSECTIKLMSIYAGFATNTDLALSIVYMSALNITNEACGSSWPSNALVSKTVELFSTSTAKAKLESSISLSLVIVSSFLGFLAFL